LAVASVLIVTFAWMDVGCRVVQNETQHSRLKSIIIEFLTVKFKKKVDPFN